MTRRTASIRIASYALVVFLGLAGWVRNLADGRVELEAEGPPAILDQLLAWLRKGPSLSHVDSVDVDWPAAEGAPLARPFQVRRDGW